MNKVTLRRMRNEMKALRKAIQDSQLVLGYDEKRKLASDPWFIDENNEEHADSIGFLALAPDLKDEETIVPIDELADELSTGREFQYISDFVPNVSFNPKHRNEKSLTGQIAVIGNIYYQGFDKIRTKELITIRSYKSNRAVNPYRCCVWVESPNGQAIGSAEARFLLDAVVAALEASGVKFKSDLSGSFKKIVDSLEELCEFMGAEYLFTSHANA